MIKTLVGSIFFIGMLFSFCKKSNPEVDDTRFSFTYNGITYDGSPPPGFSGAFRGGSGGIGANDQVSITIDMPQVFDGYIHFRGNGCGYMSPENAIPSITDPGCVLTDQSSGSNVPIDSVLVYYYQSGSLNSTISDCKGYSGTDFGTGLPYAYSDCKVSGTFDLTLVNKNNQTIKITNGVFSNYYRR